MGANKFERFKPVVVDRSQVNFAAYNPRTITPAAAKKIKDKMQSIGLLGGIAWNPSTGNLVSGHQRVSQLDKLHKGKDYKLSVDACDPPLDDKEEKEMNIFLNNPHAQGEYSIKGLENLGKEIDLKIAGFDGSDLLKDFGEQSDLVNADEIKKLADTVTSLENTAAIIQGKHDDVDFYLCLVFRSHEDRKAFTDRLGLEDNTFQSPVAVENNILDGKQRLSEI